MDLGQAMALSIGNTLLRRISARVSLGPERPCLPTAEPWCAISSAETARLGSLIVQVFVDGVEVRGAPVRRLDVVRQQWIMQRAARRRAWARRRFSCVGCGELRCSWAVASCRAAQSLSRSRVPADLACFDSGGRARPIVIRIDIETQ